MRSVVRTSALSSLKCLCQLTFDWSSTVSQPEWNIHVMQISYTAWWKPQDGCSQVPICLKSYSDTFFKFFTGTSGYVKSFNYDSGSHLADQHYTACIRQELGYCSIAWTSVTTTR